MGSERLALAFQRLVGVQLARFYRAVSGQAEVAMAERMKGGGAAASDEFPHHVALRHGRAGEGLEVLSGCGSGRLHRTLSAFGANMCCELPRYLIFSVQTSLQDQVWTDQSG